MEEPGEVKNLEEDSAMYRCRFYENQYPEPEELVMVNVNKIGELGVYVTLLEYNDIEVKRFFEIASDLTNHGVVGNGSIV